MRSAILVAALMLVACAAPTYSFSDDVMYGWRCQGDRTFVAVERGGDNTALIKIGDGRYLMPFSSIDRTPDAATLRFAADDIRYEKHELMDVRIANIDGTSANLTGVPEGDFLNCRSDPTVAS